MKRTAFAAILLIPVALYAIQSQSVEPLSKELKAKTIETLADAMDRRYVFPELGQKAKQDLTARLARGEYDSLTTGLDFERKINQDLQAICKDAHLGMKFSKEPLPVRKDNAQPSEDEIRQQQENIRLMNGGILSVERLPGNVGYIDTSNFMPLQFAKRPIAAAMEFVQDTDALIVDMRRNGGGSPETVQFFCSYFFPEDKSVHLNSLYYRESNETEEFWTLKDLPGKRYGKEVYVLSAKTTGSAAEEFCYNLKNLKRSTIVGESTWGGANPGAMVRLNDHFSAFIPTGRAINPYTKTNWEGTGVEPDVKVAAPEAKKAAHVLAVKALLANAKSDQDRQRLTQSLKAAEGIPQK